MPPTFGAFARRTYANDNPLIGYPLAYQYLTTLRPDALPASADELLRKARPGWLVHYSFGDPALDAGCRWSAPFGGTPACRRTPRRHASSATAAVTAGTRLEPAVLRRQRRRAVRGTRRTAPGRRA